jgi:MSHA biogenesis protein MshI
MRWPWTRKSSKDQFVVSWSGKTLAFVRAQAKSDGNFAVLQWGVEHQGDDSMDDFVRRLQVLGLKGGSAHIMLRADQYQLLQVEAPPVAPEELRSAARYQIRDMISAHMDDITMDVLRVGDGQNKAANQLFVVAAATANVRETLDLADAMHWAVTIIDVQETAQRNLQSAMARREGRLESADAFLMIARDRQAVLTISANDELYFSRRLDLPAGFMDMRWANVNAVVAPVVDAYTPVAEYVPDYSVGGAPHGVDYSGAAAVSTDSDDAEKVQRVLVEVRRSIELWGRAWSNMPLAGLRVSAGERSEELAIWLRREMGLTVSTMDLATQFGSFQGGDAADLAYCVPLLGVFLRAETRKL